MSEFTAREARQHWEEDEVRSLDDPYVDHLLDLYYEDVIEDWQDCLKCIDYVTDPATTRVEIEHYITLMTPQSGNYERAAEWLKLKTG
jgi:hypothetical protein